MGYKLYSNITCLNPTKSDTEKMEKVFIFKKSTQRKTLKTLKTDVFELPDNKIIGKLFSKYELISLDQANFSSDPSQMLILQYRNLRASSPPLSSLSSSPWPTKTPLQRILIMLFVGFHISLFALSKLDSLDRSTATLSSIQSVLNSLQNGRRSFTFITLLVHTTTHKISIKNSFPHFSYFSPPYSVLTCS